MVEKGEVSLDIFTKEAVLAIIEKFRKHDIMLKNMNEDIKIIEKRLDSISASGSSKSQPLDALLIERLKNAEEKLNKIENIINILNIPKVDREILEKLK